jgi:hypothetical protein
VEVNAYLPRTDLSADALDLGEERLELLEQVFRSRDASSLGELRVLKRRRLRPGFCEQAPSQRPLQSHISRDGRPLGNC